MEGNKYDFSGWATKFNIKCADGRTITPNAFDGDNGKRVPLVWQHQHDDPGNVLGYAVLEKRPEGMYAYGSFNDTEGAKTAKALLQHGDINSLSIYANKLKQKAGNVYHGLIREVSLVLSGANPGALIDNPVIAHSDEVDEEEAVIYNDSTQIYLAHSAMPMAQPVYRQPMPMPMPMQIPVQPMPQPYIQHAAMPPQAAPTQNQEVKKMPNANGERTVADVFNSLSEEQKNVVYYILGAALDGDENMKHNVFDGDNAYNSLMHAEDVATIFENAKRGGSLKEAVQNFYGDTLSHAVYNDDGTEQTYGIANMDYLFPEYRNLNDRPDWIKRDTDWVNSVMNGVHHTPFSRIKSQYANITMDEARAKGYIKGNYKKEEVFNLLRRTTDPQTIYKKQKMDRDDILDITDFDVVAWLKGEMRLMLDEEIARAILIGDGRSALDEDKVQESHVRPIATDDDLYTIKVPVTQGADEAKTAKNIIISTIKARKDYKGSGNLTFFTTEDWLTEMLLLEDGIGHPLYADTAALARKMRVNKIVTVPVMENQKIGGNDLIGVIVDMKDYNVGADKGASVEMFDDFDIDYNQYKYLIETRISGALIKPYSAMVLTLGGSKTTYTAVTPEEGDNPKENGWYVKEGDLYRLSNHTTVKTGETYYAKS